MRRGRRACVALLALVCAVGVPDQSEGTSTAPSDAFPTRPFAAAEPPLGSEHLEVGGTLTGLPAYSEAPGALHQDAPQVTGRWAYAEGSRAPAGDAPRVTDVELISPHRLPEDRVRAAIGDLVGQPRSRNAVRESLTRLWALGLFSEVRVEEVDVPDGVRLRYHLARRPHLRALHWTGDLGIDVAWLTAAVGLALGEDVDADRLAQARESLLALYRREGYFGARVAIETTSDPETNGRDVTIAVGAGEPARVGEIRARGPNGEARRVLAMLGLETGDRYRETVVRERVRAAEERLRKDGWFEARVTAGSPTWDPVTNRVDLDLEVTSGPRFRVEFSGNTALSDVRLRERLTFPESGVVDAVEIEATIRQQEAAYRERGYHFVEVTADEARDGDVRVIRFQVREGPQVVVASVGFTGNQTVSEEHLAAEMATRPPGFLQRGLFRQDVLERDVRVVQAFLRAQGFAEATVGPPETRFTDDRRRVHVVMPVAEGPRLTVTAVDAEGARALTEAEVLAALPLKPGDPWAATRADEGRREIARRYARRGYHAVAVEVETARTDGGVRVTYRVREGPQTRIGRILLRGLVFTREAVVRRELGFRSGDPFDPELLATTQRRLGELGLFDAVRIEPLRPPPTPFADVEVTVSEAKPWHLELGLGYGSDEGARGLLDVGHDNLFGTGRSLSLRQKLSLGGEATDFSDRTDVIYREPRLFETLWQGEAALLWEQRDELGYDLARLGLSATIRRDLFPEWIRGLHSALRYRLEDVRHSNVDPGLVTADVEPGHQLVASLTAILDLDWRDNLVDPRRGSFHFLSVEGGGAALGGEINFVKTRLETHWFFDWLPPTVFAFSGRLGLATPLFDTPALAIEDRFFAGGATTVRGYRENRLGPRTAEENPTGGNALLVLNAEWRFPIWGPVGGAVFVDAGAVTPEVDDLDLGDLRAGAGAGLRIATPVGPVRVDAGYALDPIARDSRLRVYFMVGHPF
jgi:outer membrane protein insertion porin family